MLPRLTPSSRDLADLQSIAAQDPTDTELDVEKLSLQELAPDEYGAGILRIILPSDGPSSVLPTANLLVPKSQAR